MEGDTMTGRVSFRADVSADRKADLSCGEGRLADGVSPLPGGRGKK